MCRIYLLHGISQDRIGIAPSFCQHRCIISRSWTSSKVDGLDLIFKVTELFIDFVLCLGYLKDILQPLTNFFLFLPMHPRNNSVPVLRLAPLYKCG